MLAASVRGPSNQVLSEVLRAGRASTARLSPLSTPDSILMCYRHRSRTDCGAGEVDGFWLDLLAYSDSSGWGWQERPGCSIWGDRASWLSWYHR